MPRRYTKKLKLEKLNTSISKAQGSDLESLSGEGEEEQEGETTQAAKAPLRQVLENTSHVTHAALNAGLGLTTQLKNFPSCELTVPLPLFVASQSTPMVEHCKQRPATQDEWMRQLNVYKRKYEKRKHREREAQHVYNGYFYDVAEQIATQENAYYRDSYDYYYTAGNLNLMQYAAAAEDCQTLGLHVTGARLQQVNLSVVGAEAEIWTPLHTEQLQGISSEIFELQPINSYCVNHGNLLLARMLHELAIYEFKKNEEQQYELSCRSLYKSEGGPFISVAQAINSANTLAIACQDHSLRFLDIVTQQDILRQEVCIMKGLHKYNNWAQLLPWQDHCFYYACQSVLLTIDTRCAQDAINPCFASSVHSSRCESFSCMTRSQNPHLLYVASNHKLHCLDMRCLGKKLTDRAVVSWTHQMSYSPTFMDATAHEGSEFVALGSALANDQRICELQGVLAHSLTEISSPALPYAPPQLEEALVAAQLQGMEVDIYADLAERIKSCHTGLKFHRLNKPSDQAFAQLLISNSLGDIFCRRLTLRDAQAQQMEVRTGEHTNDAISYYVELVREFVQRPLKCTMVQPMSTLREVLQTQQAEQEEQLLPVVEHVNIEYNFSSDSEVESAEPSSEPATPKLEIVSPEKAVKPKILKSAVNRGPWQKSAYNLSNYSDVISTRLLSIWEIDDYDLTRDVRIDMLDEKLKREQPEVSAKREDYTAEWLQQVPEDAALEQSTSDLVPGTDLPVCYEAKDAAYREAKIEPNDSYEFSLQPHSILKPGEFTIIETNAPRPAKKAKTTYTKGF
ncbi:CG10496 [Drosophila busckii]|uniref:CG10496 n=2 Tax=Drosophila busckii TaxID=30019 RepID=A0A0M3QVN2_DROBS|nr:CG10496 [Drosophila busckii]